MFVRVHLDTGDEYSPILKEYSFTEFYALFRVKSFHPTRSLKARAGGTQQFMWHDLAIFNHPRYIRIDHSVLVFTAVLQIYISHMTRDLTR